MALQSQSRTAGASVEHVAVDRIHVTGWNPRRDFNEEGMAELARSVQAHGIIEPLVVRPAPDGYGDDFELVAGERRIRAARMVGLEEVPVVVRPYNDEQVREVMLLENLQRQELRPLEEAEALQQLLEDGMEKATLAERIGKSESWITNRLRMLRLPDGIQEHIRDGVIGVEQALMLTPYMEWPIIERMATLIGKVHDDYGNITRKRLKHDVIDKAMNNKTWALDLEFFGWRNEDVQEEFDFSECEDCDAPIEYSGGFGTSSRMCLHKKCFREKYKAAKNRLKQRRRERTLELKEQGKVDLSKKRYGSYCDMDPDTYGGPKFDPSECEGCEDRMVGITAMDQEKPVCMNPECYREKQQLAEERIKVHAQDVRRTVVENLEEHLAHRDGHQLSPAELRYLLRGRVGYNERYGDVVPRALEPWYSEEPKDGWPAAVENIPNKDLWRALIRVAVFADLRHLDIYPEDTDELPFQDYLPELMEDIPPPPSRDRSPDEKKQLVPEASDQEADDEA